MLWSTACQAFYLSYHVAGLLPGGRGSGALYVPTESPQVLPVVPIPLVEKHCDGLRVFIGDLQVTQWSSHLSENFELHCNSFIFYTLYPLNHTRFSHQRHYSRFQVTRKEILQMERERFCKIQGQIFHEWTTKKAVGFFLNFSCLGPQGQQPGLQPSELYFQGVQEISSL